MKSFYLCCPGVRGCGLSNQLYSLINAIINAEAERCPFLLVEKFNSDYQAGPAIPIGEVIDLEDLNAVLKTVTPVNPSFSNLIVLDRTNAHLEIERVEYGSYIQLIDLTSVLLPAYYQEGLLRIPPTLNLNGLKGDPEPGVPKKLILHYRINQFRSYIIYEEHRSDWITFGLRAATTLPLMNGINQFNRSLFDQILSQLKFKSGMVDLAQTFVQTMMAKSRMNVIHLRLEPDALQHWGRLNQLPPEQFEARLSQIYIELIARYFDPAIPVLVLSGTPANQVTDSLKIKGYQVHVGPKDLVVGREFNAILDLLLGEHCTDVFIGNYHPSSSLGSTFSYVLCRRMAPTVTKVMINPEHLETPPFAGTQF